MPAKAKSPQKSGGTPRKPSGSLARKQAQLQQRVRLALAMIDSIGDDGYRATRVADVIARAGVSRKTFYENFENKQELLLWTFDVIAAELTRRLEGAYRETDGWPGRVEAAIGALFGSAIENPGALRLSLLEIAAAGPPGIERRERSIGRYERFLHDALSLAPGEGTVSDTILKAVIGGFNRVLYRRVQGDEAAVLMALVPDLSTWAASYYPAPPSMLVEPKRLSRAQRAAIALEGGRAPGTLAPHSLLGGRRGLPRGDQNVSRSFVVESQRARILDAVANLVASEGYAGLKVEEIAERAAVSLVAFYEHYADKEDAFLVAYEIGLGKALASVERAYASETDWRLAIRAGIAALFRFLATERSFAHIALLDGLIATPRTAERSHYGVSAIARLLTPTTEQTGGIQPPAVTVEAIAGGLFELGLHYTLAGKLAELPELVPTATYIALAPFIGGEDAASIATGRPSPILA
ncbi:MAG TPA: TetR/AcrR family transcriptional regulator [Solirubrobacteraceae bacterium]|jgi:AcrR family transcriptional regulator|nr:TetR/AcrR family transcriptional regulator [Solirubrobacteraceae bacterium]